MNQKKISLVTGGAGFIGSHVAEHLLQLDHNVIVLDDLSGGSLNNVPKGAEFIKGSINNENLLDEIFSKYKFNYVYHLAAYAAEGLSHFIRKFNYQNNLIGSINLINRAVKHNIEHFIFTSSIAVYGKNQTPMTETLAPAPEDPYGISKLAVEMDLKAAHEMFGLCFTIFRPHNVYGEKQNFADPYRNVLGIFMNNAMKSKPMTIFGDGQQTRAFTYIDDVAPYIAQTINVPAAKNEIFNIGADKPYAILELVNSIAKAMNVNPDIEHLPARNEVKDAYSDHEKVKKVFNISKHTELNTGVRKMAEWAQQLGPQEPKKFSNIELPINMPPSWKKLI